MYTVDVLKKEQQKIASSGKVEPNFIVAAVDFSAPTLTGTIMARKRASCSRAV